MTAGPLRGRSVLVQGTDAALRHAARLLRELGADVVRKPVESTLFALTDGSLPAPAVRCPVYSTQPVSPLEDWARSGAMHLTGRADGSPLPAPGGPASAVRGALLAFAALTACNDAASGLDLALLGERAALAGFNRQAPRSVGGAYRPVPTADGWLGLSLARAYDVALVGALVEASAVGDAWQQVEVWAGGSTTAAAVERAQLLGLPAAAVRPPGAYDDEQAVARGGDNPRAYVMTAGGAVRPRRPRPLVVDLTSLWAGPLCAHLLGLAGADVVKVESTRRPDGARNGSPAFYDLLHNGHASVALDFGLDTDRQLLQALVRSADVVLEASRPRALRQLGMVAEDLVAAGTTWTSITAYGRTGPWADRVGFGDDVAAAAGLVAYDGDGVPLPCGDALADPLAGVHAAVATAAALLADEAYLIDVSMRDVAAAVAVLAPDVTDRPGSTTPDVLPPRARQPVGRAAALGADNQRVLSALGSA